ncbi:hypothetical protein [Mesorhizobium sp. CN2-181]|uniref:hypothetical protein n=1 Tax=Mesorhizobium yinganensis TaxID=3157707 RepID=UPI0032B72BA0
MTKWIMLAVGVLLSANGFYTRTYDFPNDTPVRYCFNMDAIGVYGCFHNQLMPMLIAWAPFLIGLALIAWSVVRVIRRAA